MQFDHGPSSLKGNPGTPVFLYKAFGLTLSSSICCPELRSATGKPEVTISYGEVPAETSDAKHNGIGYQARPGQLILEVDNVARFLVRNGDEIIIDRHPEVTDDCVRLFLLGSAIGALLQQRGSLVLHGSTVRVDDGCVVFLGKSGVGKSTLATALRNKGYSCLGDDLCSIAVGEDVVFRAIPAYPQTKLWADTLEYFKLDSTALRRIRPSLEKHALPLEDDFFDDPLPVKKLYVLNPSPIRDEVSMRPISGAEKMRVLRDYTYRVEFLAGLAKGADHFRQVTQLALQLPMTRVLRPQKRFLLTELVDALEKDFRS